MLKTGLYKIGSGSKSYLKVRQVRGFCTTSKVVEVIGLEHFTEITNNSVTFIDFYADWCGPCKVISPVFEKMASEYTSKGVTFAKVNVDNEMAIAVGEKISAMPTFKAYKDGKEVGMVLGADTAKLSELIKSHSS